MTPPELHSPRGMESFEGDVFKWFGRIIRADPLRALIDDRSTAAGLRGRLSEANRSCGAGYAGSCRSRTTVFCED